MALSPLIGTTQPVNIEEDGLRAATDRQWPRKEVKTAIVVAQYKG